MLGDTHNHMSRLQWCKILHVCGTLCFTFFTWNVFKGGHAKISAWFQSRIGSYRLTWPESVIHVKQESRFLDLQYSFVILIFSFQTTEMHYLL